MKTSEPSPSDPMSPAPFRYWPQDALASLVVFLVALPLCMGIALASGAPIAAGLVTGIVGGVIVGSLAGSPLQVSGPAAGLTVVCGEIIRQQGMPGLGLAVLLAGLIQLVAGILRLGQWFRAVSPAVIHGMLSGIGILILSGQIHVLVDDRPRDNAMKNIAAVPGSILKAFEYSGWEPQTERETRIRLLRSLNSLFDRQRTLQRSIERVLPATTGEGGITPAALSRMTGEFRTAQADIVDSLTALTASGEVGSSGVVPVPVMDDPSQSTAAAQSLAAALGALTVTETRSEPDVSRVRATQAAATAAVSQLLAEQKRHDWAGKVGILAVAIIFAWQWTAKGRLKLIPAPLLAIVLATAAAQVLSLPVLYVDVPDNLLAGLSFPSRRTFEELSLYGLVMSGLVLAIIASAETLLCATAVDQMHSGPRTQYDKELRAQGIGNVLCGLLGALPMTGVIVRSAANVQAGGRTRLSAILHGVWLLLFIWALTPLLRLIPTAALAGILVYTGIRLIDVRGFRHLWQSNRSEAIIFLVTVIVIVVEDLLAGVATGIILSALKLLYQFSHLEVTLVPQPGKSDAPEYAMALHGAATFLRLPLLAAHLDTVPAGAVLHVDLGALGYVDHACLELLMNWAKQHAVTGGSLVMDWESLHAKFRSEGVRAAAPQ